MASLHSNDAVTTIVSEWFALLDREAPVERFVEQRARAVEHGMDAVVAEEILAHALSLRTRLSESSRRSRELAALHQVATSTSSAKDLPVLLREIVEQARLLIGVDLAYLALVDGDDVRVEVTAGEVSGNLRGLHLSAGRGLVGSLIRSKAPYATYDYRADAAFAHDDAADRAADTESIRGLLGVPMLLNDSVIGALFAAKRQHREFVPDEVALLSALAAHAAVVIDRSRTDAYQQQVTGEIRQANESLAHERARLEELIAWSGKITETLLAGLGTGGLLDESATTLNVQLHLVEPGDNPPALPDPLPPDLFDDRGDKAAHRTHRGRSHWYDVRPIYSDHPMGHLVCVSQEATGPHTQRLLDQTASGLALSLLGQRIADQTTAWLTGSALIELLTQENDDPDVAEQHVRAAGLSLALPYTVAVVHLPPVRQGERQPSRIESQRSAFPPGSALARYGDRVVVLAPRTDCERLEQDLLSLLGPQCTAGLAGPATGLPGVRAAFREANQTLEALFSLGRRGSVETAERLGIYRLLLSTRGVADLGQHYWRVLGPLHEAEGRQSVPLVATALAFLANHQRHAPTARVLEIHPNTLYQRLESIGRVLGHDWREGRRAIEIHFLLDLSSVGGVPGAQGASSRRE